MDGTPRSGETKNQKENGLCRYAYGRNRGLRKNPGFRGLGVWRAVAPRLEEEETGIVTNVPLVKLTGRDFLDQSSDQDDTVGPGADELERHWAASVIQLGYLRPAFHET